MVVGGGTGYTNINNNKTQQLEFEVVTGCSLSPRQDTEGLSTEEEGSHRLSPLQRLLQSDLSHQEPLTATSQPTIVIGEKPTKNTKLKSGGLEDSLTASSKPPQQSYSADPHLYLSLELRWDKYNEKHNIQHTFAKEQVETVITPIAVVLDDATVPDTLTSWVLCHVEVLKRLTSPSPSSNCFTKAKAPILSLNQMSSSIFCSLN